MEQHIELRVDLGGVEPVHAEPIGGRYRLTHSPGLVYGVAAGDEIEVLEGGEFRVVRRGGNLVIRVLTADGVSSFAEQLEAQVRDAIGGRLDGRGANLLVFTVPVKTGFPKVERLFETLRENRTGIHWEFGNVYDSDGHELGWWNEV